MKQKIDPSEGMIISDSDCVFYRFTEKPRLLATDVKVDVDVYGSGENRSIWSQKATHECCFCNGHDLLLNEMKKRGKPVDGNLC